MLEHLHERRKQVKPSDSSNERMTMLMNSPEHVMSFFQDHRIKSTGS